MAIIQSEKLTENLATGLTETGPNMLCPDFAPLPELLHVFPEKPECIASQRKCTIIWRSILESRQAVFEAAIDKFYRLQIWLLTKGLINENDL